MRLLVSSVCFSIALLFSGCISVPDEAYIVRRTYDVAGAVEIVEEKNLLSDEFSLLSWNIYKGRKKGWTDDLLRFSENADLIVIQEARLNDALKPVLNAGRFDWNHVVAFKLNRVEAGVLTASKITPVSSRVVSEEEPLTGIPKTALISLFPVSSTGNMLMLINIHAVNLSPGTSSFRKQWMSLHDTAAGHSGPMIVAGDFNTWSDERMAIVERLLQDLGLEPVLFESDQRALFVGRIVDHIYFRGLSASKATVVPVSSSDHNPLFVTFRLAED